MQTGKSSLFFLHILSSNLEVLMDSLMDTQIVLAAFLMNADKNVPNRCHTVKPIEMMFAGILVSRTEAGKRESTQESTEISEQSRL